MRALSLIVALAPAISSSPAPAAFPIPPSSLQASPWATTVPADTGGVDTVRSDAAAADSSAAAYRLGEIVASVERPVSEAAATVRVITAREIEATGARTLDEALLLVPGLEVRTGGQGVPRVDLRGLRSRHVLLLLNGIPLNSTYDGQFDPAFIPTEEIERIKVTTGTGSVLYGEGGLAGTINVITRSGGRRLSGEASAEAREVDGGLASVRAGTGTEHVSVFASGSIASVNGFPSLTGSPAAGSPGEEGVRGNSDRKRANGMALVTASPAAGVQLGLAAGVSRGEYGIPPEVQADPEDRFARSPTYDRVEARDDGYAQMAASLGSPGGPRLRSWAYVNGLDLHEARYDDSTYSSMEARGSYDSHTRTRLTGVGVQAASKAGRLGRLTLGLSAQRDAWTLHLRVRNAAVGSGRDRTWEMRSFHDDRTLARYGTALEYQVRPTDRLGIVAGYMHHWLRRDAAADTAPREEGTTGADGLMAAVSFDASSSTRLRVAASRKFRFPTIRQLYDEVAGNPTLGTERSDVVEAGVHQQLRRVMVDVTVYRMTIHDFIERPSRNEPFANFQRYRFTGVELAAEARPTDALTLRGGYTFMDAVDASAGAGRQELQYRPRHHATLETGYAFPFGFAATATASRVAGQYYYSRQEPVEKGQLPDYTIVGLRLVQDLSWQNAAVYAGADNLFDVGYEEEYGSPRATRTLYVGARVRW